tara:strand:+ start:4177 stop:5307 length:1131 start_codon:yes stop_codon:yes gene_type:complete
MKTTKYYEEFKRYYKLAEAQQAKTNLGWNDYQGSTSDDLMNNVQLYDVVERKLAGFSQIVNDAFYGSSTDHPYYDKIQAGHADNKRKYMIAKWDDRKNVYGLREWLYVFLVHRITGSAINYGTIPSGYHNTILFDLYTCDNVAEMAKMIPHYRKTFYTSIGYQFPKFPKPPEGYKRGGDYYLSTYAPRLVDEMASWLENGGKRDFRKMGDWMFEWNEKNGLCRYKFQYAAFLADIADWFPEFVNHESHFYYGTNAVECISYLIEGKKKDQNTLDSVMDMVYEDLGSVPYNAEDVCCDFIRWVENYVRPGAHYDHVDRDTTWSSCTIEDHPRGRQKAMLDLGLVESFNTLKYHPSDLKVLEINNLSIGDYQDLCKKL